jgi:hypothetical protein
VFGRRKRQEEAAAEAAREAERHALFAKLAERPENICPFLGLADERAGYVEGVSDDHRCYAFGDPAPLSAEQQTRVCQERGYGNCPRYLRGVLVIPTEELEALRRPRAPLAEPPPPPPPAPVEERRRRRAAPVALLLVLLLVIGGGAAGYLYFGSGLFPVAVASPSSSPTADPSGEPTPATSLAPSATPAATPEPTPPESGLATPTPEPTPEPGDRFTGYEVAVGPQGYTLFRINSSGVVVATREASFDGFSFARVQPRQGADEPVFWRTAVGGLKGWSYLYPDSGNFRIRAVFRNAAGERRSAYLTENQLTEFPEATPAP